jgi:hypothetical protein
MQGMNENEVQEGCLAYFPTHGFWQWNGFEDAFSFCYPHIEDTASFVSTSAVLPKALQHFECSI